MSSLHINMDELKLEQLSQKQIAEKVKEHSETILSIEQHRKLFKRFFEEHVKAQFADISFLDLVERQMVVSTYDNGKRIRVIPYERNGDETYALFYPAKMYQPLEQACLEEGIIQKTDNSYYHYLLMTVCLKQIAQSYFANQFQSMYGRFFDTVDQTLIEPWIKAYYSIPSIDHESIVNFSQFTYYLMANQADMKRLSARSLNMALAFVNDAMDEYLYSLT